MTSTQENAGTVATRRAFSTEQLRNVESFDDVLQLAQETGAEVVTADVLGDGFTLTDNKDELIGKEMIIVSWSFGQGDFGEFVSARCLVRFSQKDTQKLVINDGGTGIYEQLKSLSGGEQDVQRIVYVPRGLRKSEYDHPQYGHGTTYYLDTAASRK